MSTMFRVCPGNLSKDGKCSIFSTDHKCANTAKWFVFPAGPGTLDTTQFSNLDANVCDAHIAKALVVIAARRNAKPRRRAVQI
jgi:hypothetical protein